MIRLVKDLSCRWFGLYIIWLVDNLTSSIWLSMIIPGFQINRQVRIFSSRLFGHLSYVAYYLPRVNFGLLLSASFHLPGPSKHRTTTLYSEKLQQGVNVIKLCISILRKFFLYFHIFIFYINVIKLNISVLWIFSLHFHLCSPYFHISFYEHSVYLISILQNTETWKHRVV